MTPIEALKQLARATAISLVLIVPVASAASPAPFDAAPYGLPLPEGQGVLWEDPREIHKVVVQFASPAPAPDKVRLEYWGSRWPEQHLPKDRQPGGGSVGWMELGNWYNGGWRKADADSKPQGSTLVFTFNPVNAREFPKVKNYLAPFRYTLKLRVVCDSPEAKISQIEAFTDSTVTERPVRLAFEKSSGGAPKVTAFNGKELAVERISRGVYEARIQAVTNPDPNTFDRTLVTVKRGKSVFTFALDDLADGALFLPEFGAAVLSTDDDRDYDAVARVQEPLRGKSLYDRVEAMPEQTWNSAWEGMPPKKSRIYFPMGLDGGRQRFRVDEDGTIHFRSNDHYLRSRPGKDTPRLDLEPSQVEIQFGLPPRAQDRWLEAGEIPVCHTVWATKGLVIHGTSYVTALGSDGVPQPDSCAVFMCRYIFSNASNAEITAALPVKYKAGGQELALSPDPSGLLRVSKGVRGQWAAFPNDTTPAGEPTSLRLQPGQAGSITIKIPYLVLAEESEQEQLAKLDFETERKAVAAYWTRRMDSGARLLTPEPVLNSFYRAHSRHLLVNCEREPGAERRFARVGSFSYGAYGNESCMMVVDLDRRGFHQEARECLDAWLKYQGTVKLPGDFSTKEGIFYGAGGYEAGGYNQHHGWILWCMAEHYRFTRDAAWLKSAAPGILDGTDWIINETRRTADRHPLERGLLPAGSLEDIGDWWTWLSTSCYTWRGLDSAAWALEQIKHPEADRLRKEAGRYHENLLANFREAANRAPVVRLRDGTAVPHIPSHVHRRGRSFGWICETLEGALHLVIAGVIDPDSPEALRIIKDYEDNLYLSNQYGYTLDDFDKYWFHRGGMSMQACLLLHVEPYLFRDDIKHALRGVFNAIAVSHFPDVHINTEHALPFLDDWAGDHFKSSDEANACGWLRYLFVREEGNDLLLGQAVPREWLKPGQSCGIERAATHFGPMSLVYSAEENGVTARLDAPTRNPAKKIRLRFRTPEEQPVASVLVNGKRWRAFKEGWVELPGDIGRAEVRAVWN